MNDESRVRTPKGRPPFANVLTVKQVCELKGCRVSSVMEAIQRGDLPAWRFGNQWGIPKKAAEAWVLVGHRKKREG